jgi:hypothetical protein
MRELILYPIKAGIFMILAFYIPYPISAQENSAETKGDDLDTLFVKDLSHLLGARVFVSTKYNTLRLNSSTGSHSLIYRPTNQYNFGVGASYRKFTLNLGFGIPGITDRRRAELGHTKYLDAQANMFTPERASNVFLQYFNGYHISSHDHAQLNWAEQETDRPFREDVRQFNAGISTLRIVNGKRYSYRAAMNQDAWQLRSQGSWLYGGFITYYGLRADSTLLPTTLQQYYEREASLRKGDLIDAGPMGGYAYTVVIKKHFFIMGSAAAGAGISMQSLTLDDPLAENGADEKTTSWGPSWRVQARAGIGYNSARTQIGITFNQEQVHYLLPAQNIFVWNVGNIRFNIVHRFEKRVKPIDKAMEKLKKDPPPALEETVPAADEVEDEKKDQ